MHHDQQIGTTTTRGRLRRFRRLIAVATATLVGASAATLTGVVPAQAALACGLNELDQNVFLANDGLWSNPLNWSRLHIPGAGEAVCVPGGIVARVSSASTSLLAGVGGQITTLRVEGTIRIESGGTVSLASAIFGGSNLLNGGVIQVLSNSTLDLNADQNGAPAFQNVVGGSLIQVQGGSKVLLRRPFLNTGTINLTGGGQWLLDSSASAYTTNGTGGTVIGGQFRQSSGTVTFDGSGALSVLSTGGSVRGTLNANQSLDLACSTSSSIIGMTEGLTNNGTIRFVPPLAGVCNASYTLPAAQTWTNNGSIVFGTPGVAGNGTSAAFGSNFFNAQGLLVNSPTGTITVNDHWLSYDRITNQGTLTVAPGGFLQMGSQALVNPGTFVNGDRCDLRALDNTGGTVELQASCGVAGKATFTSTSTLRPHWSPTALTKLVVGQSSPLDGTVNVITDGTPSAVGVSRDLITGPVSGTFANVTSQSTAVSYTAANKTGNTGVQLTTGPGTGAKYQPLVPARLLETRTDAGLTTIDGQALGTGLVPANTTIELQVTGRAGIPNDATAVVLNIAVTGTQNSGFITVFPCGTTRPTAANLNYAPGDTIPNLVIAKIGTNGKVCLYTLAPTHLIADANGYFPAGATYDPLVPARLLETRTDAGLTTIDGQALGTGLVPANTTIELQVTGRAGIPNDATAVVLNIAVTGTQNSGFITVFPCGTTRPTAANLNYAPGDTIPNLVIAKIGTAGKVCLYTLAPTHLIADANGYFPAGATYDPLVPARLLETRTDAGLTTIDGQALGTGLVPANTTIELQVTGRAGIPNDATAVVLNIAVTGTQNSGFITVFPCGTTRPTAANLNYAPGDTIPNLVIAKIGTAGKVCLYTLAPTHLIADANGYFPA